MEENNKNNNVDVTIPHPDSLEVSTNSPSGIVGIKEEEKGDKEEKKGNMVTSRIRERTKEFSFGHWVCQYIHVTNVLLSAAGSIIAIALLLNIAPFQQMGYAFLFFLTLFIVAAGFLVHHVYVRNGNSWKMIYKQWDCVIVPFLSVAVFCCFLIMLAYILPESFKSTANLTYHRIGGVTPTTARFMIRAPNVEQVFVQYQAATGGAPFLKSSSIPLKEENDFTGFIEISGLLPNTEYFWTSSHDNTTWRSFKTFPGNGTVTEKFKFYWGSCFLHYFPNFQDPAGWNLLESFGVKFIIFLGDFIYADLPWYKGTEIEEFRALYRQSVSNKFFLPAVQSVPNFWMWDDHELYNDFSEGKESEYYKQGIKPWDEYLGFGNPANYGQGKGFFSFDHGDSAFFMLDTRSYRDKNSKSNSDPTKTMLGSEQKQKLFEWLLEKNSTSIFKFILSTIAINTSKNVKGEELGIDKDDFAGFETERKEIISFIRNNFISGVVFLTGDSHFLYSVELEFEGSGLFEFSSSPIAAFDDSLGGFFPEHVWLSENLAELPDVVRFYDVGENIGQISLLGTIEVETNIPEPYLNVSFYRDTNLIRSEIITINMLRPKPV